MRWPCSKKSVLGLTCSRNVACSATVFSLMIKWRCGGLFWLCCVLRRRGPQEAVAAGTKETDKRSSTARNKRSLRFILFGCGCSEGRAAAS